MGNFMHSSTESGPQRIKVFKDLLKNLADLLSEYPALNRESKFIMVPGPTDPGYSTIYPRPAIPNVIGKFLVGKSIR